MELNIENGSVEALDLDKFYQRSRLYQRVSRILSNASSVDEGMNKSLAMIGETLHASRVYVFENSPEKDGFCANTFEWCAEGIRQQKEEHQHCFYGDLCYETLFSEDRFFCCTDADRLEEPMRSIMKVKGAKASMNYAFFDSGRFAGFVGIDDCVNADPLWLRHEEARGMMNFLSDLLTMFLIKERNLQKALAAEALANDSRQKLEVALGETRMAAEQNAEFLSLVNELVNAGTWHVYLDENGNHTEVNWSDSFRKMLGFENEEEFPNRLEAWTERLHPEDREMVLSAYMSGLQTTTDYELNYRMLTKSGHYEWFSVRGKLLKQLDGKPRMLFGTMINITEREMERTDLKGRLNAILGGVKGGLKISYNAPKYPYFYISESVAAIQGYTPEEMMAASGGTAVGNGHPEDIARIAKPMLESFYSKGSYSAKYRVRHKNGNWMWIHDYGMLVKTPQGEEFVYSLIQDIDEEERTKHQLEMERRAYKEALMQGSSMHYVVDLTEGYICDDITCRNSLTRHADPEVSRRWSYDELQAFTKNQGVEILDTVDENVYRREAILKRFEEGQTQLEFHSYNRNEDSYMRVMVLLYRNDEDGHVFATYIHTDETQKQRAEIEQRKQLEEALEAARQASDAKSVFLSNMSHDIRTPMNAIMGFAALAQDHLDDRDRVGNYLSKIETAADHMLSLMNEILEMSRIEFEKTQIVEEPVSLPEFVRDINNIIEPDIGRKKLKFVPGNMNIDHALVQCDNHHLKQVILNCLTNAVKYTPAGGTVAWYVDETECPEPGRAAYVFRIRDTGIGMSPEFARQIFEPFTREQTSTVNGIPGTGLGMAITKKLVELMGGTIRVESEKNRGSEFIISLPLRLAEDEPVNGYREADPGDNKDVLRGLKILLAEDNPMNREIATELLEREGARVFHAVDGLEAVRLVQDASEERFDLVFMDLQMPVMDGYEAARHIREMPDPVRAGIPIIALSANAFEEDRKRSLLMGMNAHVMKPIDMSVLCTAVKNVICEAGR